MGALVRLAGRRWYARTPDERAWAYFRRNADTAGDLALFQSLPPLPGSPALAAAQIKELRDAAASARPTDQDRLCELWGQIVDVLEKSLGTSPSL